MSRLDWQDWLAVYLAVVSVGGLILVHFLTGR